MWHDQDVPETTTGDERRVLEAVLLKRTVMSTEIVTIGFSYHAVWPFTANDCAQANLLGVLNVCITTEKGWAPHTGLHLTAIFQDGIREGFADDEDVSAGGPTVMQQTREMRTMS